MSDVQIADGGEVIADKKYFNPKPGLIVLLVAAILLIFALGVGLAYSVFTSRLQTNTNSSAVEPLPTTNRELVKPKVVNPKAKPIISDINAWLSEVDGLDLLEPTLSLDNLDLKISIPIE